jgi:hypothetical protein
VTLVNVVFASSEPLNNAYTPNTFKNICKTQKSNYTYNNLERLESRKKLRPNKGTIERNHEKNKNMAQMVLLNIKNQVFQINE